MVSTKSFIYKSFGLPIEIVINISSYLPKKLPSYSRYPFKYNKHIKFKKTRDTKYYQKYLIKSAFNK